MSWWSYYTTGTLSEPTVAAMYAMYTLNVAALAWAVRQRVWPMTLPRRPSMFAGCALVATGLGLVVAGMSRFRGSAQLSGTDVGNLHTAGVYRYSRNPKYLGVVLAATGGAVAARSAYAGLLATGVGAAYRWWIPIEERHLIRAFGDEYRAYAALVGRWLAGR